MGVRKRASARAISLPQPCCLGKQKLQSLPLMAEDTQRLSSRGALSSLPVCSNPAECPLNVHAVRLQAGGFPPSLFWGASHVLGPRMGHAACPRGPVGTVRLRLPFSHVFCGSKACAASAHLINGLSGIWPPDRTFTLQHGRNMRCSFLLEVTVTKALCLHF